MHTPVLLQQAIENLNVTNGGLYIDATFGEGGYSKEILNRKGKVLAIDSDIEQLKNGLKFKNFKSVQGNFADIEKIAKEQSFFPVDGIVFDLGLSMKQIEFSGRGFSYNRPNEPLDMRLDKNQEITAADLIRSTDQNELYEIFSRNSEDLKSREIALEIKTQKTMEKVSDLIGAIDKAIGFISYKTYARIFQALRIEVNNEFESLKKGLEGAVRLIKKEGRIIVVSFHSLEDRIVKNFVRTNRLKFLEKGVIRGKNKFERSAKLRTIINS